MYVKSTNIHSLSTCQPADYWFLSSPSTASKMLHFTTSSRLTLYPTNWRPSLSTSSACSLQILLYQADWKLTNTTAFYDDVSLTRMQSNAGAQTVVWPLSVQAARTSTVTLSTTGTGDAIAAMAWATSVVGAMIAMPSTP